MKRSLWLVLLVVTLLAGLAYAENTNLALNKNYVYNIEPHQNYPDDGGELTDGQYANPNYADVRFHAHLREDFRIVIIDLEDVYKIDLVTANFLNQEGVGSHVPTLYSLATSTDGKRWRILDYQEFFEDEMPQEGTYLKKIEFETSGEKARFVALKFNVDVWAFMDEMEVLGDPASKEAAPKGYDLEEIDFEEIDFDF